MGRIIRSMERGIYIGAQVGVAIALGAPLLGFSAVGFAGALGLAAGTITEAVAGLAVGAGVGGALFGATSTVFNIVPGMREAFGAPPPREHRQQRGRSRSRSRGEERSPVRLEETDDRNVGWRRMIEEQQQREEMMDNVEMMRGR